MGPLPFAGMLLSDLGADVVRIDRLAPRGEALLEHEPVGRGRRSVALDLKNPDAVEAFLRLCESADAVIEGFRPGVAERLGIGPETCRARNPRLVYGRMTGWGQDGPLAQTAGHDINYIALAGALPGIGTPRSTRPARQHRRRLRRRRHVARPRCRERASRGEVVGTGPGGRCRDRGRGGAPHHRDPRTHRLRRVVRETRQQRPRRRCRPTTCTSRRSPVRRDRRSGVPVLQRPVRPSGCQVDRTADAAATRSTFAELFATRTRQEWCDLLEGTDACFAPVLSPTEATRHPANRARNVFVEVGGVVQPAPAPRFSRTPPGLPAPAAAPGAHTRAVLGEWGVDTMAIDDLLASGAAGERPQSPVNEGNS